MDELVEIGCICCRRRLRIRAPAEIHHLVEGGKRLGHRYTIPLCSWHHRGVHENPALAEAAAGPSLANGKRPFVEAFGTERELLDAVDSILERRSRG